MGWCSRATRAKSDSRLAFKPCSSPARSLLTGNPSTRTAPSAPSSGMACCAPVTARLSRPGADTHQVQLADLLLAFDVSLVVCKNFEPVAVKKGGVGDSRNMKVGARWWPVAAVHGAWAARPGASSNLIPPKPCVYRALRGCCSGGPGGRTLHELTMKTFPQCKCPWPSAA